MQISICSSGRDTIASALDVPVPKPTRKAKSGGEKADAEASNSYADLVREMGF